MVADLIAILPPWVIIGTLLGAVATVLVAAVFYVGNRLSPPPSPDGRRGSRTEDHRRRREIRAYLTAIGEQFLEDALLGTVVVPFYLPERHVAITFDAHDYFTLDDRGVFTVLCEHELPGHGLGQRLPFEVPDPGDARDAGASSRSAMGSRLNDIRTGHADPVSAAFAELGLPRDATPERIRSVYRQRVKQAHPDQGGDERTFRRIREAYSIAQNHATSRSP